MLDRLDAAAVRRWCAAGLDGLRRHQAEIDDLNVYPVPDGDTGTNLVLTFAAAHEALAVESSDLGETLSSLARAALLGARGNSGVIVAQMFKGMADALAGAAPAQGRALAGALHRAARSARDAVGEPVEGTVLSVADGAAQAAAERDSDDLVAVVTAAAEGAARALARTPEQLPVLAAAGVVDAGGRGLCVLLEALVEVVTGVSAPPPPTAVRSPASPAPPLAEPAGPGYEVMYLLDAPDASIGPLGATLAGLGDSLVIVDAGAGTWNVHVHVHVDDVGAAIEAGIEAGRPHRIAVTRFADQPGFAHHARLADQGRSVDHASSADLGGSVRQHARLADSGRKVDHAGSADLGGSVRDEGSRGAVVVVTGAGLAEVFRGEGAVTVAGPNPSTGEILAAIRAAGAGEVTVLPNRPATHGAAAAAAEEARADGVRVGVIPTRSPVQALAALAVRDTGRRFEDDLIGMAEAAGACRYAEVTTASREAVTVAGVCRPGDVLALIEGEVNLIGADLVTTCRDLVDRLLAGGGELVTLVTGAGAPEDLGTVLREHLAQHWAFVEVQILHGGQPSSPLVVGVE